MSLLPRMALGALGDAVDPRPMLAALLGGFLSQGIETQVLRARSSHVDASLPRAVTGRCPGYLDSWLMSPDHLRRTFAETARGADLALVTGEFAASAATSHAPQGGSLELASQWLDLPRVALVSARAISLGHLPARPATLAGLLVDGVSSPAQFAAMQPQLEQHFRAPVLGYLPELPALRAALARCCGSQAAQADQAHRLGRSLVLPRGWRGLRGMLRAHAQDHPILEASIACGLAGRAGEARLQIAVAYDEAFGNYFPDSLDALETGGAAVRTFSPLRDEALPEGVDLVILCGGRLAPHVGRLASNQCLLQSLRRYVAEGGRVYAEGGGMAYLSENITLAEGESWPMLGALPLAARLEGEVKPSPCELVTTATSWLARRGTLLRGYRDGDWRFEQQGPLYAIGGCGREPLAMVGRHNVIGSRLQLHLAAQPGLLENVLSLPVAHLQSADF